MANDTPVGKVLRSAKYNLVEGDPLIGVLKPELVNVMPKNTLAGKFKDMPQPPEEQDDDSYDENKDIDIDLRGAPNLSDITIVKKEKVRDGNKNDFVRFTINVKNHIGDSVVGVKVYGI